MCGYNLQVKDRYYIKLLFYFYYRLHQSDCIWGIEDICCFLYLSTVEHGCFYHKKPERELGLFGLSLSKPVSLDYSTLYLCLVWVPISALTDVWPRSRCTIGHG